MIKRLILLLLMTVILASSVSAISLSSSLFRPNPMLYEPGLSLTKTFTITQFRWEAAPYVKGDLRDYAEIEIIANTSAAIVFKVHINLPDELEPAGVHELIEGAREIAPPTAGIIALTKAQKLMKFMVLYDEKIASFKSLETPNVNENEKINFAFGAESLSKQKITGIHGDIKIYDFDNNFVKSIPFETFDLESAERKSIYTEFDSFGFEPGQYYAKAEINWEDQTTTLDSSFHVGTLQLEVINHSSNFTAGQINKVTIDIESQWKGIIEDVFAEFYVGGGYISTTQTYSVDSFETKQLEGFLDLSFIDGGTHDFRIILNFEGEQAIYDYQIEVQGKAKQKPVSITFNSIELMMILVIVILILIIVIMFLQQRKKNES